MSKNLPRLIPTGTCWCGCGAETAIGSFFARGHDKTAEAAFLAIHHDASVAQMLHAHGYGPDDDKSVTKAAVDKGLWQECPRGCGYRGARESINNHVNRHHRDK
ncbi:hypothetical protein [Streptomyces chartreusis]|jgi:hypothetical protein|uniref:hypothetical protein n=1 Tax=Streptomyces chartreusis TaxID=1969 RepID=UPI0037DBFD74|nr:hypothetical protein OG938_48000 [Streptomyces chartreusis]